MVVILFQAYKLNLGLMVAGGTTTESTPSGSHAEYYEEKMTSPWL